MITQNSPEISFLVPAKNASQFLEKTLNSIHEFLEKNFSQRFEIVLILNGEDPLELQNMMAIAERFSKTYSVLKVCFSNIKGKGAALKAGFLESSGQKIFFTDADLPFDLDFFLEAHNLMDHGFHFISGNRRFGNSLFTLPVSVLPMAYGRHRIGLLFNKVTRTLFKIKSHDTQAGIKAFSRRIGELVFSLQTCPGFLFDIEFFLVAGQNGFKKIELPVHLYLNSEKSTVRIIKETMETGIWLAKIYYQNLKKHYRFKSEMDYQKNYFITADDWGLSPSVNRGILTLAKMGIVTRVSILSDGLYVSDYLDELTAVKDINLGVHFNLTYKNYFRTPIDLLISMLNPLKRLEKEIIIRNELERQFALIRELNLDITYADGHHHCHIFPVVVSVFSKFLAEQNIRKTRLPSSFHFLFSSKILLIVFSAMAKKHFKNNGLSFRPFFYPDYSKIHSSEELRNLLLHKLEYEIITHPSDLADLEILSIDDSYNHERVKEYHLFKDLMVES